MTIQPKGIIPPIVTPLDENENVNKKVISRMVNYLIKGGVHGLFPLGSTGEGYGLSFSQKKEIIETVVETTNKRVPVYAGTGAITTKEAIRLTRLASDIGVDAVSVVTPFFIKPNEIELYNHYQSIASSTSLPIILYNNPGLTGINLSVDLVVKLSQIDNIVGIKDSSGDMAQAAEYIRRTGDDFAVLAGRDILIYGFLAYGGKGAVASTANIVPQIVVKIYEEYQKGNYAEALKAQFQLAPLRVAFNLGSFPVIMKEGLKLLGIDVGYTLKPIEPLTEEAREKLKEVLRGMQVL
ncbi:MAG: 4-hydroxy-tetrahydrodipicolinate synthase [Actinobacteria bacterium RBG_13_35_12]|nr:MAG: 4-hydroxy-tetrahydrodipicolinate synthase [Actinobacteria bacterium RBG_13_35_12]